MLKNIADVMDNINSNELDTFFTKTDATFKLNSEIKETKIDYSWLSILEDTLPSVDKIVRNPRRFIIPEEDVVIVEKTKRVSQETIKHLAQHCENIQDIDENDEVVPKKLLNVHKEETVDLYENRFIYTLVKRLENFIARQLENIDLVSNREVKREASYRANTVINEKKIDIELKINEENKINLLDDFTDYKTRILACYEIISGFNGTEMIRELENCSLVTSPIRKTNLILKQHNFQKAHLLWQYLDNFEYKDPKVVNYESITDTSKETKDEFTLAYFIECNAIDDKKDNLMKYKDIDAKLDKLMNEYVYENNQDINNFIIKTKDSYKNALTEKQKREEELTKIYKEFINSHNVKIDKVNEIFN